MEAVVARLFRRRQMAPPDVGRAMLNEWSLEFGGSADLERIAVDLVAFTEAVDHRMGDLEKEDFRLQAKDAIRGVRARYLEPLGEKVELRDLLDLVSLAKFEIPIFPELISASPKFGICINDLGIVIEDFSGLEVRRSFRLVHHALGELLLKATVDFDAQDAIEIISRKNSSIVARIMSSNRLITEKHKIKMAMEASIYSGAWRKFD